MASKLGSKIGFDESEQKEFNRALKQNLLVQTPLQVLLETLYTRLQSQAQVFNDLQRRVERMEARDIDGGELLQRIQLCEGKLNEFTESKLSPFNQQDIISRIEQLEQRPEGSPVKAEAKEDAASLASDRARLASAAGAQSLAEKAELHERLESRLSEVESKLNGVYNLPGKLLALETMADESGFEIPDLEYSPSMTMPATSGTTAQIEPPSLESSVPGVRTATGVGPAAGMRPTTGVRLADVSMAMQRVVQDNMALKSAVQEIQASLSEKVTQLTVSYTVNSHRLDGLESSVQEVKSDLTHEIVAVKAMVKRDPEVSFADFSRMQSQVQDMVRDLSSITEDLTNVKDMALVSIRESIEALQQGKAHKSNEPSDIDKLFHQRISTVEAKLDGISNEVKLAVSDMMEDVATLSELEGIGAELDTKAGIEDLKLLALQQAALAQSVNGMAEWLAVRPETADGTKGSGSSATRFKCLTCDREIKTQGGSNGSPSNKGNFLPKLDAMQSSYHHSGGPIGPGLHAVENRERASAGARASPPLGPDFEAYGDSRHESPNRSSRAPNSRVAVNLPATGLRLPPGPRVPVFI